MKEIRVNITLANAGDAHYFAPGQRVTTVHGHGLRARIWRWLTKQNLRVVMSDPATGYITVERCR